MAVTNIQMNNLNLNVDKAVEIKDASNISIENSTIIAKESVPSIYIENGTAITFDNIKFDKKESLLLDINGTLSNNILLKNSDRPNAEIKSVFNHGASQSSLKF